MKENTTEAAGTETDATNDGKIFPRAAIYVRMSLADERVVTREEWFSLFAEEATNLGYSDADVYADRDWMGRHDDYLKLVEDCGAGLFKTVILLDLSAGFAEWGPYEQKLGQCGVECVESRVSLDVVREKAARWSDYSERARRQKHWERDAQTSVCDPNEK